MKGIPLYPVGKGLGVCSKSVLKQPQTLVGESCTSYKGDAVLADRRYFNGVMVIASFLVG